MNGGGTAMTGRARRTARRVNDVAFETGERFGIEWIAYSPPAMYRYHQLAKRDAQALVTALETLFPDTQSWIDVGAGTGAITAEAQRRGHAVLALERNSFGRRMAKFQGVEARRFDLADLPPAEVERDFELAYCFEVAEHVPSELADALVAFIAPLAPAIVFSAAAPGQGGHGHINEQPRNYWIERFAQHGVHFSEQRTRDIRSAMVNTGVRGAWYFENTMVFERRGTA
jgi:SAM-dependent methyltransferase